MRIVAPEYTLWTEGNDYKILNNGIENEIIYTVSLVENTVETIIINDSVLDAETGTIAFTTEGVYKLKLTVGLNLYYYDIRHFPSLKTNIVTTLKTTLCNYANVEKCTTNALTTELYKFQLLFNSTNLYKDLLLSPSFIRNYQYTFTTVLDQQGTTLLTLLQDSYNTIATTGDTENSIQSLNLYLSYIYIMLYVIDMDTLLYDTDIPRENVGFLFEDDDTEAVRELKTLYGFDNLIHCFESLNIDAHNLHALMYDAYVQFPLGLIDASSWETIDMDIISQIIDFLPKAGLYDDIGEVNKLFGIAAFDSEFFKSTAGAISLSDTLIAFIETPPIELTAENVTYPNATYPNVKLALDQLLYVAPNITNITGGGSYEKGVIITTVTLNWTIDIGSAVLTSQELDNGIGALNVADRQYIHSGQSISTNRTYRLDISDGTTPDYATEAITFYNKRYWGTSALTTLADVDIQALSSDTIQTRVQTRSLDATGGKYLYFAMPTSYGCTVDNFKIGGLSNSDWVLVTRAYLNLSGYSESYDIFRSGNIQTGNPILVEIT